MHLSGFFHMMVSPAMVSILSFQYAFHVICLIFLCETQTCCVMLIKAIFHDVTSPSNQVSCVTFSTCYAMISRSFMHIDIE